MTDWESAEWYECQDCGYGTNSPRAAARHAAATGHDVKEADDE